MNRTLLIASALLLVPMAAAEDASRYPAGVSDVRHDPLEAQQELAVAMQVDAGTGATGGSLYVCHFGAGDAAEPDVCYTPSTGHLESGTFSAGTEQGRHPAWAKGTSIGYKVALLTKGDAVHVPADGGYFRVTVGQAAGDGAPADGPDLQPEQYGGGGASPTKASPGFSMPCVAGIGIALLLRRR